MTDIPEMRRIKRIHFIGIGGAGMCGIAEVLMNQHYIITGSDLIESAATQRLSRLGINVYSHHSANNILGVDVVVVSTAISNDNLELEAAKNRRIPVIPRAEMLAELMRFRHGVAVAGTHGKTTTTSLLATIFAESGLDPTYVIGGLLNRVGGNAKLGKSRYFIAEADESDASFLHLHPMVSVITNIDIDHMETYQGSFETLKKTFIEFIHNLPFYGLAIVCADDPAIASIISSLNRPYMTYGFSDGVDYQAIDVSQNKTVSYYKIKRKNKPGLVSIELNLPGKHNVLNSLAAFAVANEDGVDSAAIAHALKIFSGIKRRFQSLGSFHTPKGHIELIDDYGHHPTEIQATISAVRNGWQKNRLVMIFQPHRYTRTRDLFEDFAKVLSKVDVLLVLNIYSAGEKPISGVSSLLLCQQIEKYKKVSPIYIQDSNELDSMINHLIQEGDLLLTQGAGDIEHIAHHWKETYFKCITAK
jgi:UDP-N-acetylmuramate--alanine ligase